jgi:hypothetical protein
MTSNEPLQLGGVLEEREREATDHLLFVAYSNQANCIQHVEDIEILMYFWVSFIFKLAALERIHSHKLETFVNLVTVVHSKLVDF